MSMKTCPGCGETKPFEAFHRDTAAANGLKSRCKECRNPGEAARLRQRYSPRVERITGADAPPQRDTLRDIPPAAPPRPVEEQLPPVVEHRLKGRVASLEMQIKSLLGQLDNAQRVAEFRREATEIQVDPIVPRERGRGPLREATALACASDWHIEEEVKPEQVAGRNRYNLEISQRRMERFFEAVRYAIQFNRQIFKIRDLVLWLGGDIITNYLREEDVEANLLAPPRAIAYAVASVAAGIRHLLEDGELERIVIPCNDGNHGRLDGKSKIKHRTRTDNSLEWLMYTMLAREFAGEPRVQFQIAAGEMLYYEIYGRTVRFLHGDIVHYAGGVGGVTIPLYKAVSRWDTVRRADLTVLGHFHQLTSLSDLIINGSLIGYSPYSVTIGARFEPPAQAFTILDPMRFKSVSMPLWVGERGDDQQNQEYDE
jgi:hypothetical protein